MPLCSWPSKIQVIVLLFVLRSKCWHGSLLTFETTPFYERFRHTLHPAHLTVFFLFHCWDLNVSTTLLLFSVLPAWYHKRRKVSVLWCMWYSSTGQIMQNKRSHSCLGITFRNLIWININFLILYHFLKNSSFHRFCTFLAFWHAGIVTTCNGTKYVQPSAANIDRFLNYNMDEVFGFQWTCLRCYLHRSKWNV